MKKIEENSIKTLELMENNYRLIYTFIMAAALVKALEIVFLEGNSLTIWVLKDINKFRPTDIFLLIIYLFTFIRFLLGDFRYLDIKHLHDKNDPEYAWGDSSFSRFIDFLSLVVHAILFYILAASISNFNQFYIIFIVILMLNSFWLLSVYWITPKENRKRFESIISFRWAMNNIICVISLFVAFTFLNKIFFVPLFIIFLMISILNTVFDYALAWKMYFPDIQEEIIELKEDFDKQI